MIKLEIKEPEIKKEQVLVVKDEHFNPKSICIVTGGASGIGRAVAIAMAANNTTVVVADIDEEGGAKTVEMAKKFGKKIVFVKTNLLKDEDVENCVKEAARFGSIKFLANIAGIQHINSIENFPMNTYDTMQKIMLRAPFYLSKLVIPYMKKSADGFFGVIGNMASVHGHICTRYKPVYNIIKFGLRGLTQSIAAEGAGKIRSFSVSVGYVSTPLVLKQIPSTAKEKEITPEEVVRDVMLGRSQIKEMMTPVEVANLYIIGFSHLGKYLVAGDLLFDGGMVLTY